ncbi:Uncharacterised protein [Vibrio cholerae]|nr:Uncharacterised protein [Vibrio cholerae]
MRHFCRSSRHKDRIKRSTSGPTLPAIAMFRRHVIDIQLFQASFRIPLQGFDPLNSKHMINQFGEHCGLITRARTNF